MRGGVLSLSKMTTALSVSGLPRVLLTLQQPRPPWDSWRTGKASAEVMQDKPRLLETFQDCREAQGPHQRSSKVDE